MTVVIFLQVQPSFVETIDALDGNVTALGPIFKGKMVEVISSLLNRNVDVSYSAHE